MASTTHSIRISNDRLNDRLALETNKSQKIVAVLEEYYFGRSQGTTESKIDEVLAIVRELQRGGVIQVQQSEQKSGDFSPAALDALTALKESS